MPDTGAVDVVCDFLEGGNSCTAPAHLKAATCNCTAPHLWVVGVYGTVWSIYLLSCWVVVAPFRVMEHALHRAYTKYE